MARLKEGQQPYSNMKARRIVLLVGFFIALAGFICALAASIVFFLPELNFVSSMIPVKLVEILYIASLALSFVGCVLCVAGANTLKGLARLGFFLSVISFIVSAGFLVVILFFDTLIPFGALGRLHAK